MRLLYLFIMNKIFITYLLLKTLNPGGGIKYFINSEINTSKGRFDSWERAVHLTGSKSLLFVMELGVVGYHL